MDVVALSAAGVAAFQQGTQQKLGLLAIKTAAEAQNQLADMLEKASAEQPALRTNGPIGTNINTTA